VRLFVKDVSLKILGKEVTVIAIEKANGTHGYPKNAGGFLQPDLQYVIHPSGTNIANALVLGVRTTVSF
jgi:carbohydrate-selective porin OprB